MTFSRTFISALILGSLALTSLSVVILLVLLARDYVKKRMW